MIIGTKGYERRFNFCEMMLATHSSVRREEDIKEARSRDGGRERRADLLRTIRHSLLFA